MYFHDREDHTHQLKQIGTCTQSGGPNGLDMETLSEVLECAPESGLKESSLKGTDKQHVPQAEVLLSINTDDSLFKLGFQEESHYVRTMTRQAPQCTWQPQVDNPPGYSTLSWVRMCSRSFDHHPITDTREDANLQPMSKPFVSWRTLF